METETEKYYETLRRKLVFHIREQSVENQITPREFHKIILPKFPGVAQEIIIRMLFEMTEMKTNKWVYHSLLPQWVDYDKKEKP